MRFATLSLIVFMILAVAPAQAEPTKRALIVVGLPGDEAHEEQFTEAVVQIRSALTERFGFPSSNIAIYFGRDEETAEPDAFPTDGRGTREEIAEAAKRLVTETAEDDVTWVVTIGHSYYDGRTAYFNIPDRDITHGQFGKAFKQLGGKSTFLLCMPVSGFYIKEMSKPGRVIITSTEADVETNATIFHTAIAKTMTEITTDSAFDLDKDGKVSLFDFYITATRNLSDLYLENDPPLIATEHPQLDDNGDGRGSELQIDYLTIAQGGRSDAKRRRNFRRFKDGELAKATKLEIVSAPAQ